MVNCNFREFSKLNRTMEYFAAKKPRAKKHTSLKILFKMYLHFQFDGITCPKIELIVQFSIQRNPYGFK